MNSDIDKILIRADSAVHMTMLAGEKKYEPFAYRKYTAEQHMAAVERHIKGEGQTLDALDAESGHPHLAHAITRLAMILQLNKETEQKNRICKQAEPATACSTVPDDECESCS